MSLKQTLEEAKKANLLHVAFPRACTVQQTHKNAQQPAATNVQQPCTEANKDKAFECNKLRNNHATTCPKPMQQTGPKRGAFVARLLHPKSEGSSYVWRVQIDQKCVTAIDPQRETLSEFKRQMIARFGSERVGKIERKS